MNFGIAVANSMRMKRQQHRIMMKMFVVRKISDYNVCCYFRLNLIFHVVAVHGVVVVVLVIRYLPRANP